MPQPHEQDHHKKAEERLQKNLDKLQRQSEKHVGDKYGISSTFAKEAQTEAQALAFCEKAMETLATEYIELLARFKESSDPLPSLNALEQAEVIWRGETTVINQFDGDGQEKQFLQTMRQQAYVVMQDKLEEAARECRRNTTDENAALCLALLAVMDGMLEEFGRPPSSPDRQRFREIAKNFQ